MTDYKLTYFGVRGLGEQIRLLMHDNKIAFTDDKFTADKWPAIKATMAFGQVPCLYDGGKPVVQSGAIMRHLGRKHDLYGSTECEKTFADVVFEGIKDLHSKYVDIIYRNYSKKAEFVANVLPVELALFEKLVKTNNDGKGFLLGGDKTCFVDYSLFEELDILLVHDPHCLEKFPTLKAYHGRMHARPNLQTYLKSDCRKGMKINGNDNT